MPAMFCKIINDRVDAPPEKYIDICRECPYPQCIIDKKRPLNGRELDPIHYLTLEEKKVECQRRVDRAVSLKRHGLTHQEIADEMGCALYSIKRYLRLCRNGTYPSNTDQYFG